MSQMLWHLTRGDAKSPNQIDYLVKMNLPPLLGRRNAIFSQAARLLKGDLFAIPDLERQTILNSCVNLLDEAINNTEAIIMTLSNADTAAREHQLHTFFVMVRDLVEASIRLCKERKAQVVRLSAEAAAEQHTVAPLQAVLLKISGAKAAEECRAMSALNGTN